MKEFLTIAWRNIWRNRRRTIIIVLAITFSVAITVISITLADGSHDDMLEQAMRYYTGYIQIYEKGYQDDPEIEKSFKITPEIKNALENTPDIAHYTPRLQTGGLIGTENNSIGGFVAGIAPETEKNVTIIHERIVKGEYLADDSTMECLVGEKMAEVLSLDIGSELVILSQSYDGSTGALRYKVKGIFKTGTNEIDRTFIFINIRDAQSMLRADNLVSSIVIVTESPHDIYPVVNELKKEIDMNKYEVLGWRELMPELLQFVTLDSIFSYIFLGILLMVIVFGVLSAVFSSVLERTDEFGIMLALGTRPSQIRMMVMMETACIVLLGLLIGLVIGLGLSYYYMVNPIVLGTQYEDITSEYGMSNEIPAAIYPLRLSAACLIIVFISLAFSYYPAWKASRMNPNEAIRDINK